MLSVGLGTSVLDKAPAGLCMGGQRMESAPSGLLSDFAASREHPPRLPRAASSSTLRCLGGSGSFSDGLCESKDHAISPTEPEARLQRASLSHRQQDCYQAYQKEYHRCWLVGPEDMRFSHLLCAF